MGAQSQQYLLSFGGVRVVPVLIEPLLQRSSHILQGLTFVSNLPSAAQEKQHGEAKMQFKFQIG